MILRSGMAAILLFGAVFYSENWIFQRLNDQRHAKRDLRTYAKSVDSDQLPRLRRRVWSESVGLRIAVFNIV